RLAGAGPTSPRRLPVWGGARPEQPPPTPLPTPAPPPPPPSAMAPPPRVFRPPPTAIRCSVLLLTGQWANATLSVDEAGGLAGENPRREAFYDIRHPLAGARSAVPACAHCVRGRAGKADLGRHEGDGRCPHGLHQC